MTELPILISIVIPTWNRPTSVLQLVQSISQQNIANDIEIVIVDDHSEEANWERLVIIRDCYQSVRLYRNPRNIGMTRNWNEAIRHARGKWIGFMCDDDMLKPDSIMRAREYIFLAQAPCLIIQNGFISSDHEWIEQGVDAANRVGLPPASGQFWHREITEKLGGYDERIKYCPDAEFWLRVAYHYPVLLIRDFFAVPHQHETNYMWEIFQKPDFIEQVTLSIKLSSKWILGEQYSDKSLVKFQIDDGIWETMRTVLNNTFLKRGKMTYFPRYLFKFIRYSFALNRKWAMLITISRLPILRIKDLLRPIVIRLRYLKND